MDQYTKETIQRYKTDLEKHKELEKQIYDFQAEDSRVLRRLGAYERILTDALGSNAFKELHQEFESEINSSSAKRLGDSERSVGPELNSDSLTTTDIILKIVEESGSNGVTAAQVFDAAQSFGIGKKNAALIYGTLSRLNTGKRVRKFGKRYFSTSYQSQ